MFCNPSIRDTELSFRTRGYDFPFTHLGTRRIKSRVRKAASGEIDILSNSVELAGDATNGVSLCETLFHGDFIAKCGIDVTKTRATRQLLIQLERESKDGWAVIPDWVIFPTEIEDEYHWLLRCTIGVRNVFGLHDHYPTIVYATAISVIDSQQ